MYILTTTLISTLHLQFAGYSKLPKSKTGIKDVVINHADKVRSFVMSELDMRRKEGKRFSLTFDEWTSVRNRRYMIVNVHEDGPRFWSLGLIRVHGSMPAETCVDLIKKKLQEFGLNLEEDIVAISTDGASVMCKVGKLISPEHQLCLAHGVHLAVQDTLYNKKTKPKPVSDTSTELDEGCMENEEDMTETESNDEEIQENDNPNDYNIQFAVEQDELSQSHGITNELSVKYQEVVNKVRKVVKKFRKSPTMNDSILQKYVLAEYGKDLGLVLDVPTRWNSLLSMLQRFALLRTSVQKALIDIKLPNAVSEEDFMIIDEMISSLEPVALAVQVLSRRDVNLISAEAALSFCCTKLDKQHSELAQTMRSALLSRIGARHAPHSAVLRYLHSGSEAAPSVFGSPLTSMAIKKFIHRLVMRLDAKPAAKPSEDTGPRPSSSATAETSGYLCLFNLASFFLIKTVGVTFLAAHRSRAAICHRPIVRLTVRLTVRPSRS